MHIPKKILANPGLSMNLEFKKVKYIQLPLKDNIYMTAFKIRSTSHCHGCEKNLGALISHLFFQYYYHIFPL